MKQSFKRVLKLQKVKKVAFCRRNEAIESVKIIVETN